MASVHLPARALKIGQGNQALEKALDFAYAKLFLTRFFMDFDALAELEEIKRKRKLSKRKRYSKSRIDKLDTEVLRLRDAGASLADIQIFLSKNRIRVVPSTIQRWLKKHG